MMSETLYSLEQSVNSAGNQLDSLATKLTKVEKNLVEKPIEDPQEGINEDCVLELLESVSDVTTDYQSLRKDLQEVQHLQREMNTNLRYQMQVMTQTFRILKKRIEANSLQPHIQAQFYNNNPKKQMTASNSTITPSK